jgi:hypothetical protein
MIPIQPSSRDWEADYSQENGCYLNECTHCHSQFYGHKHRRVCKVCFNQQASLQQNIETSKNIPGNVRSAILQFLAFGTETKGLCHNGYYSKGGGAYDTLVKFLKLAEIDN